jgi:hypothetical protein
VKTARQSDRVTWWRMGRAATHGYGLAKALAMAEDVTVRESRQLFLDGVHGRPRPRVRPLPAITYTARQVERGFWTYDLEWTDGSRPMLVSVGECGSRREAEAHARDHIRELR